MRRKRGKREEFRGGMRVKQKGETTRRRGTEVEEFDEELNKRKSQRKAEEEEWGSEGRNEGGKGKGQIRGGQCFDVDHRALVFIFNTAEGISLFMTITLFHLYNIPHPPVIDPQ